MRGAQLEQAASAKDCGWNRWRDCARGSMRQASRIWITRATSCRGRSVPRGTVGRDGGHAVPMSRCEADIGGFEPAKTCPATRRWYTLVIHNVRTGRLTKPYFIGFLGLPEPAAESPSLSASCLTETKNLAK